LLLTIYSLTGGKEIDVDANNPNDAKEIIEAVLAADYEPNGEIKAIEQRFGLYW
jgi:hypothetical protein